VTFFAELPEVAAEIGRLRVILRRAVTQAKGTPIKESALITEAPVRPFVDSISQGFHSPAPSDAPRLPSSTTTIPDTLDLLRTIADGFYECGELVSKVIREIEKRR
jgi:hypothetical protein